MNLKTHVFRLTPEQDLKKELTNYCQTHGLKAATLISGVGSLKVAALRLANEKQNILFEGPFEIVSLTGTLGLAGLHLHIAIANKEGVVQGGHLVDGSLIHTTAEIVLLEHCGLEFKREFDAQTGFKELVIK